MKKQERNECDRNFLAAIFSLHPLGSLCLSIDKKLNLLKKTNQEKAYRHVRTQIMSGLFESFKNASLAYLGAEIPNNSTWLNIALSDTHLSIPIEYSNLKNIASESFSILRQALMSDFSQYTAVSFDKKISIGGKIASTGHGVSMKIKNISLENTEDNKAILKIDYTPLIFFKTGKLLEEDRYKLDIYSTKKAIELAAKLYKKGATDFFTVDERFLIGYEDRFKVGESPDVEVRKNICMAI